MSTNKPHPCQADYSLYSETMADCCCEAGPKSAAHLKVSKDDKFLKLSQFNISPNFYKHYINTATKRHTKELLSSDFIQYSKEIATLGKVDKEKTFR
jgi:hypothetical protein